MNGVHRRERRPASVPSIPETMVAPDRSRPPAHDLVGSVLSSPGRPLEADARTFMEPRFGHDFGKVRIHSDAQADRSARAVDANAYTVGAHVVFREGAYAPASVRGRRTLAHELAHVIQQTEGLVEGTGLGGGLRVSRSGDRFERAADTTAAAALSAPGHNFAAIGVRDADSGHPRRAAGEASRRVIQRQPRVVEGEAGEVILQPVTLLDFMQGALTVMRGLDRSRQERARIASEEQSQRDQEAKRRREAEEKARQEEDDRQRLEALERQRLEAEEKLRQEEANNSREEEEEEKRAADEQARKLQEEKKRANQEVSDKLWRAALAALADQLVQLLRERVGTNYWSQLDVDEHNDAIRRISQATDPALWDLKQLESNARRRKKKLSVQGLREAVLNTVRSAGEATAQEIADEKRAIAVVRLERAAEAAELVKPVLDLSVLIDKPTGAAALMDLYRAAEQGLLEIEHSDTYRSNYETEEKRGHQFGPFSREYLVYVRTVPTRANSRRRCDWVIHVHFKSSNTPNEIEYLHLKTWVDKKKQIPHVINVRLLKHLGPLLKNVSHIDQKLPDIK